MPEDRKHFRASDIKQEDLAQIIKSLREERLLLVLTEDEASQVVDALIRLPVPSEVQETLYQMLTRAIDETF